MNGVEDETTQSFTCLDLDWIEQLENVHKDFRFFSIFSLSLSVCGFLYISKRIKPCRRSSTLVAFISLLVQRKYRIYRRSTYDDLFSSILYVRSNSYFSDLNHRLSQSQQTNLRHR